jgi:hypothetical protein
MERGNNDLSTRHGGQEEMRKENGKSNNRI